MSITFKSTPDTTFKPDKLENGSGLSEKLEWQML